MTDRAPTPDRELPAPWTYCRVCGGPAPALPDLDGSRRCPACTVRELLNEHAHAHLTQTLTPHLSAWAQHWAAAGLTPAEILDALEQLTGAWMHADAQREHLTHLLTDAQAQHPAPTVTPSPPDRLQLDAHTLPVITAYTLEPDRPASEGPGCIDRRVYFTLQSPDGREQHGISLPVGCDALLIPQAGPDGDALLYFTGTDGRTDRHRAAYRVPVQHLDAVRASLGYTWATGGPA